ncbi:MAG: thioredoxin domain-containing protein [Woeseiaceae bacterium]|nr:thioredoxin domain-containing protein [Woeseiaceae bacterium]
MSRLAAIFALAMIVSPSLAAPDTQEPEVLGILFYADWCGSCKILEPEVDKARGKANLDNEPVLFVRLDLTDATRRHQAAMLASSLGIGDFFDRNAGATGFMLLVDAESKEVISTLTKKSDAAAITEQVKAAIRKAAG